VAYVLPGKDEGRRMKDEEKGTDRSMKGEEKCRARFFILLPSSFIFV